MDLARYDTKALADEGVVMYVRHPGTGEPLLDKDDAPVTITLAGVDSDRFRDVVRSQTKRRLNGGSAAGAPKPDAEAEAIELLVKCTLAWSGIGLGSDRELECTPENVRAIYSDPRVPWLRQQVDRFIADRANFLKASATT